MFLEKWPLWVNSRRVDHGAMRSILSRIEGPLQQSNREVSGTVHIGYAVDLHEMRGFGEL